MTATPIVNKSTARGYRAVLQMLHLREISSSFCNLLRDLRPNITNNCNQTPKVIKRMTNSNQSPQAVYAGT